jgi:hypothetical protein
MHSPHDYRDLIARWRAVCRRAGLRMKKLARTGRFDLFTIQTPALDDGGGIYISAGVHGDEPAATEALLMWAEKNAARLRNLPLFLAPCINPAGLVANTRMDANGDDLNRMFHRDDHPVIGSLKRLVAPHRFALALQLHEDYDGCGFYIYEVARSRPYWGETLLDAARPHIAIEARTRIDGRIAAKGLVRRKIDHRRFRKIGFPEAIWLHMEHSERTFTIESPSEFALDQRIRAQMAVIDAAVKLWGRNE